MKKLLLSALILSTVKIYATLKPAYHWVANTDVWNNLDSNNWNPKGIPGMMDTVIFDGSSFNGPNQTVTISGNVYCGHIIFENLKYTGTKLVSSINDSLNVTERMELSPDLDVSFQGTLIFSTYSSTQGKINTHGKAIGNKVVFKSPYGSYNINGNFSTLPTGITILNEGKIQLSGNAKYSTPKFHIDSGTGYPSGLDMYDYSQLIINSEFLVNAPFNVNMFGASKIVMDNKGNSFSFKGNYDSNVTYGDIEINAKCVMQDANTFGRIALRSGAEMVLPAQQSIYVNSIVGDGAANDSIKIHTDVAGLNAFIEDNGGGTNCLYYVSISDVYSGTTASFNCTGCNTAAYSYNWINQSCSPLTGTVSVSDSSVNCYGSSYGAFVTMSGNGSTGEYTYIWGGADPYAGPTQSTSTGLSAGTFTLGITAGGKDTVFQTITITQPDSFKVAFKYKDISCYGANDGIVWAELTGGTAPYNFSTYSWTVSPSPGNANTTIDTLFTVPAATYTVSHPAYDNNYCVAYVTGDTFTLKEPAALVANSNTKWTDCYVAANGEIYYLGYGGTLPYTYNWTSDDKNKTFPDNDTIVGLVQGTYTLQLSDANGCTLNDTLSVSALYGCPSLYGNVTYQLNALSGAQVMLLAFDSLSTMKIVDSIYTDINGYYEFDTIPFGKYLVFVDVPTGVAGLENALSTYYDTISGTNAWIDAFQFNIDDCQNNFNGINIDLIEVLPLDTSNLSTVSGHIYEGPGFVDFSRLAYGHKPNQLLIKGVTSVDVSLKKKPSGQLMSVTSTDSTGFFEFVNIPDGNYQLYVDFPGLPMDSTYFFSVSAGDTIQELDYYIDSSYIYIEDVTSVKGVSLNSTYAFKAYPTPFHDVLNVKLGLTENAKVKLDVLNVLGEVVYELANDNLNVGNYNYQLSSHVLGDISGIYFIRFQTNERVYMTKIIYAK